MNLEKQSALELAALVSSHGKLTAEDKSAISATLQQLHEENKAIKQVLKEIGEKLRSHPDFTAGNSKVHYCAIRAEAYAKWGQA